MNSLNFFIYTLPAIIIALTIHEAAHAFIAYKLGDPTAKQEGRVSLNPLKHLDLYGSLLFLIAGIGWGKPVPINPHYFKNPKRDQALTALAGPLSNLILAFLLTLIFKLTPISSAFLVVLFEINVLLCAFNLIPIPPLDGSKILAILIPQKAFYRYQEFLNANLSYLVIFLFADIYLMPKLLGFSIIHNILNFLVTLIKTILFLGV